MRAAQARQNSRGDENRWAAVLARDAGWDGQFVFAVSTTGIYCRPSCPSRRPRRKNVTFYTQPDEAERAGFRACRRCRPREASAAAKTRELVERVRGLIDANLEEPVTLERLATEVGMSAPHLQRTFKRATGVSPKQYADAQRLKSLKTRLRDGQDITGALYESGYGSSRGLYERAPHKLGMTPGTYRKGGEGMEINYTIEGSPLGRLLVARTERGICSVSLADTDKDLERRLRSEFPRAEVRRDRNGLSDAVRTLVRYLEGKQPQLDLPLDVRGTAFQCQVWEELLKIPFGRTKTYAEVARAVGKPKAARAVGSACGRNPVPLVIPCHRVVRGSGALGGYGLGLERKKKLLAQEKNLTAGTQRSR